jgi:TRAP-type C4-dicarboxylate transport system substrate-binding protein
MGEAETREENAMKTTPTWRPSIGALLVPLLLLCALPSPAATFKVKMATMVPENSPWDKILKDMGAAWSEGTGERVALEIYPGGVAGDEPDIVRKMRIGQFHAAALSVSGLADIDEYFKVFEIPLFYRDVPEMVHVLEAVSPMLEKRLAEKKFKLLGWGYAGFVHFFTTERVETLDDLKQLKIFSWAGNDAMVQWWRGNGFHAVPLAATDVVTGLQTGLIEAVSAPPLYAMQVQYYKVAPYMLDIGLVPMMGAMLITERAWNRISEADRAELLAAAAAAEEKILTTIPKLDEAAIKLMASQGLEVMEISESEHAQEFIDVAVAFGDTMRGGIVPEEIFDAARRARAEHRARQGEDGDGGGDATTGVASSGESR